MPISEKKFTTKVEWLYMNIFKVTPIIEQVYEDYSIISCSMEIDQPV